MLVREAQAALRAAAAAFGSASWPAAVRSAFSMTIFWFGQMTPHTLANMTSASRMPVAMLRPGADW